MLKNLYTLENIEAAFQNHSASYKELLDYIETVLNEIKSLLESYNEYLEKKKELKEKNLEDNIIEAPLKSSVYKSIKNIRDIFLSQQKEITLGQKPRKTYFKDIEILIK